MQPWGHEENRVIDNLAQHYDAWRQAERTKGPGHLQWKRSRNRDYLYRIVDGKGNGHSLGPRDEVTEAMYAEHRQARQTERRTWMSLQKDAALYRSLRLPRIAAKAADLLLELDLQGWLGEGVLVVGTTAMAAYQLEAATPFAVGMDATEDFDLTWRSQPEHVGSLHDLVKQVDSTYTVNTERPFQMRNAAGYEVELLLAKSLLKRFPSEERFRPVPLEEQDWLLLGRPVSQVVLGTNQRPARLVVPDPRYFALQKLWLAQKAERRATKRPKDQQQGKLLLDAIAAHMPHYELTPAFGRTLPDALRPLFQAWRDTHARAQAKEARSHEPMMKPRRSRP